MLHALTIADVVLIDRLRLDFAPGLCALTGETGAGKSILLDALGLALGERAEAGLVRNGAAQASVTAEFDLAETHPSLVLLRDQGLEAETPLVLRRTVGADGRSRAFVNDQPVSAGLLRQLGALLVEIHGQFATQGLLDAATHRALLDDYAGIDLTGLAAGWRDWAMARDALKTATEETQRLRAEEEYLRAALEDLDTLAPQPGEEGKLAALRQRLLKRTQWLDSLGQADSGLAAAEQALGGVWRALDKIGAAGKPAAEALDRVTAELREATDQVRILSADLEDDEHDLPGIDDRLFALRREARKHHCTIDELASVRDGLADKLVRARRQEETLDALKAQVAAARAAFIKTAARAAKQRRDAAAKLDRLVAKELPPLKLDKARFVTDVQALAEADWGPHGADAVRFIVSTNPGAAPGPLDKIASGGEMARFMLALKVVLAATGAAPTLIFDEVDTGIGGGTAAAVGERLARLAATHQVLVVTHAPQVAAQAAHHWLVAKTGDAKATTRVTTLNPAERREEIARMLSGAGITDEARAAADKLLVPDTAPPRRQESKA